MIDDIKTLQNGVSFLELIEKDIVIIPKIQRDYAQGRETEKIYAIRETFISSLIEQLLTNNCEPLSLDFIYGSEEKGEYFFPLDGQQRLTTLFLLHWYLTDNTSNLCIKKNGIIESRFTYHVRTSSKLFCNELVQHNRIEIINDIDKESEDYSKKQEFSMSIKNQKWFLWEWNKDPTIKSMLVMLDSIHQRLNDNQHLSNILQKLEEKKIVFNLLPLKEYGFKDELYVKMNARGKPLSDFDILKSTFEEQMKKNNVDIKIQLQWQNSFDSVWFSMFWNALAKEKLKEKSKIDEECYKIVESIENRYKLFLLRIISLYIIENQISFSAKDWNSIEIKNWIPDNDIFDGITNESASEIIQKYSIGHTDELIHLLCKLKFFNADFFLYLIHIFDSLIDSNQNERIINGSSLISNLYFDRDERNPAQNLLEAFTNPNVTLEIRFQFYALILYLRYSSTKECNTSFEKTRELNNWMRIIRNLTTQTNTYLFNKQEEYISKIQYFKELSCQIYKDGKYSSIYDFIEKNEDYKSFRFDQLKEEQIKVKLLNSTEEWKTAILLAENHKYLTGQIKFLLDWSIVDEKYDVSRFQDYYNKFSVLFSDNGISEQYKKDNLFTNLMLKLYDTRYCFRGNNPNKKEDLYCLVMNDGKDRDFSWKNYLRIGTYSTFIKDLLDTNNIKDTDNLETIAKHITNDWRDSLSQCTEIISAWMYYKKLDFFELPEDKNIVRLFTKKTADSISSELETVRLYYKIQSPYKEYYYSNDPSYPYSVCFYLDKKWEKWILIEFLEELGLYQIESNFNPNNTLFQNKDDYWYYQFDRNIFDEAERLIQTILEKSASGNH